MAQGVCVITEFRGGAFRRVSFEVASEGRRLADALGEPLLALALGHGVAAAAADLGHYGVERVYAVDQPQLQDYLAETFAPVAAQILQTLQPKVVLTAASVDGKDLSARLGGPAGRRPGPGLHRAEDRGRRPQGQKAGLCRQGLGLV